MSVSRTQVKQEKLTNRTFLLNALICTFVVVSSAIVAVKLGVNDFVDTDVYHEGISINDVYVGGLAQQQARSNLEVIEQDKLDGMNLTLCFDNIHTVFTADQLGISTDLDNVLNSASSYVEANGGTTVEQKYDTALSLIPGKEFDTSVTVDDSTLTATLRQYSQQNIVLPVNASVVYDSVSDTFAYAEEQAGYMIDYDALLSEVKHRIAKDDFSTVFIDKKVLQPEITVQMLQDNTALISEYTTDTNGNEKRNTNVRLMCEAINGLKLEAGQTLSLNELVGRRTAEKGFQFAPAIVNGQMVEDVGGGICQLSGTLYNAALLANMEIVERVRHTWPSDYLPIGQDSTLNWNDKDLKLRNNSQWPIYIYSKLENNVVTVKLYGQPLAQGHELTVRNEIIEEVPAPKPEVILTNKLPIGETKVKTPAHDGYKVKVYRDYYENEVLVKSELISSDFYRPQQGVVLMGSEIEIK